MSRNKPLRRPATRLLPFCIALALAAPVAAQEEVTEEDAASLDRLVITGSRLKRSEVEGPTPVLVFER
ncbi:MAG: hypothetical protein AAGE01_19390, partial [Pseudomonadota bacterium]